MLSSFTLFGIVHLCGLSLSTCIAPNMHMFHVTWWDDLTVYSCSGGWPLWLFRNKQLLGHLFKTISFEIVKVEYIHVKAAEGRCCCAPSVSTTIKLTGLRLEAPSQYLRPTCGSDSLSKDWIYPMGVLNLTATPPMTASHLVRSVSPTSGRASFCCNKPTKHNTGSNC